MDDVQYTALMAIWDSGTELTQLQHQLARDRETHRLPLFAREGILDQEEDQ